MSTFIERWHPKGITPQFWVNYRPTKTKKIQKPGSKLGGSYIPLTQNLSGVSDSSLRSWFFLTFKRKSIHPVMHSRYRSRLQNNDAPMLSNQTSHLCNEDLRKGPHSPPDCSGDVGLLGRAWHKSPWILASRNRGGRKSTSYPCCNQSVMVFSYRDSQVEWFKISYRSIYDILAFPMKSLLRMLMLPFKHHSRTSVAEVVWL